MVEPSGSGVFIPCFALPPLSMGAYDGNNRHFRAVIRLYSLPWCESFKIGGILSEHLLVECRPVDVFDIAAHEIKGV